MTISRNPAVVGFSVMHSQNVASLLLAQRIKEQMPQVRVIFGGANCESVMGSALARLYPQIDVVVRGEAEGVLPRVVEDLIDGRAPRPLPGLVFRDQGRVVEVAEAPPAKSDLEHVPEPNYDEYFERLEASPWRGALLERVWIPFESARGCWWGEKHHCTFCGLNGMSMTFRRKPAERVRSEVHGLAARYRHTKLAAVDNIIDMKYFGDLLPSLQRDGLDLRLFYETKANLTREQVRLFRDSGTRRIQPGIESLDSAILHRMKKGVTVLQNLRTLKWARHYGVEAVWNIIYGIPGEDPAAYGRMARLIPKLHHLQPPGVTRLRLDRFSPYHSDPAKYGLRGVRPLPCYAHIYRTDEDSLRDLAYFFSYDYSDDRNPADYAAPVIDAVATWQTLWTRVQPELTYHRGPGFLTILDGRTCGSNDLRHTLGDLESRVYLACEDGATADRVYRRVEQEAAEGTSKREVSAFLNELTEAGLLFEEGGKYLALAVPVDQPGPAARRYR